MKKILIAGIVLVLLTTFNMPVNADDVIEQWVVTFDEWGEGKDVAVDSNDNIIVTGSDFDTIKYDKHGNELWNTTFPSGCSLGVAIDSYDNVIIVGYSGFKIDIVKFDANGNELWNATNYGSNTATGVAIDSSNNIIVTGYSTLGDTNNITTFKYDADGNEIWNITYDSGGHDFGKDVAIDSSDNIIVTGYIYKGMGIHYYYTIKYDADGNELWNTTFDAGDDIFEYAYGVTIDSLDDIIVTGWFGSVCYTIKYDSDGNELWNATYDVGIGTLAYSVATDSNDNIIISGDIFIGHSYWNIEDGLIVKYDSDGNEMWNITYDSGVFERFNGVTTDSNNNIIVTGYKLNVSEVSPVFLTVKYTDDTGIIEEIDDMIDDITDTIYDFPDDVFINNPDQRKNAFSEKFDEVYDLIIAENYTEAINKLLYDIRAKADGSLGGNPNNDWITDPDAQAMLCDMIDELIAYIETLL